MSCCSLCSILSRKPTYCTFVTKIRCSTTQSHLWWCSESESTASSSLLSSWTEQFIGYEKNPWIDQKRLKSLESSFLLLIEKKKIKKRLRETCRCKSSSTRWFFKVGKRARCRPSHTACRSTSREVGPVMEPTYTVSRAGWAISLRQRVLLRNHYDGDVAVGNVIGASRFVLLSPCSLSCCKGIQPEIRRETGLPKTCA